jgi:probable F420-dependent oxidoreductase
MIGSVYGLDREVRMHVGVTIPNNWGVEDPRDVIAIGELAEELGYDSLWVMDHLFHTGFVSERLGTRPYFHPLATLSALSMTTSRIALGTSVMVLPYHDPVELAKYVATLDHLSRGRVLLGVGAGALVPEFEALGVPVRERGARTDESIAVMQDLWTNPDPAFEGRFWRFSDVQFWPKPVQQPHPPIWVGGASPGARRRTALLGNAWHPNGVAPEDYPAGRDEIRERAAEAGRDPGSISMTVRVDVRVPSPDAEDRAHRATIPGDDPARIVDALEAYAEAEVEHTVIALGSGDVPALREVMQRIAAEVIPAVR